MSRINKQIAKDIAKKLTQSKFDEYRKLGNEKKSLVENFILSTIPKKILEIYYDDSLSHFLEKSSSFWCTGVGLKSSYLDTNKEIPKNRSNIHFPDELAEKIEMLRRKQSDTYKEANDLLLQIESSLLALGTFKRVQEQFPEAAVHLPKTQVATSLVVNIKDLRKKINS